MTRGFWIIRMVCKNKAQCIGALHTVHYLRDRLQRIPFVIIIKKVCDDLRIGFRYKFISLLCQTLLKL